MKDNRQYNLKGHNTFGIDASCERYVEYESIEEAQQIHSLLTATDEPVLILGAGSNALFTANYPHAVISAQPRFDVEPFRLKDDPDGVYLKCWAGTTFDDVVAYAVNNGMYGAENLSLIPGQVGASAVQNIGAYGAEAKDIICQVNAVELATGRKVEFSNSDCHYSYRQSRFKHDWKGLYLITYVTYRLSLHFEPLLDYGNIRQSLEAQGISWPNARQLRQTIIDIRKQKLPDPAVLGNAGSFFMNPIVDAETFERMHAEHPDLRYFEIEAPAHGEKTYKIPAGWMMEQCGWKGRALGPAAVHDKQALVLVNKGGATGADVVKLMHAIQHDVQQKFGIMLHPEVNIIPAENE